jgi:hypothetical protein
LGNQGTAGWQRYEVVLDVPKDATSISFGVLLTGGGEVWLNSTKFDVVGDDIPVTGWGESLLPNAPVNLEFTEQRQSETQRTRRDDVVSLDRVVVPAQPLVHCSI